MAVLAVMCFGCFESQVTAESELSRRICAHNITAVKYGIISCNDGNLFVLDCYCATYNMSEEVLVGACVYNCGNNKTVGLLYHPIPNEVCASLKRTGALCGKCYEDHFVSAYSFDLHCMPCDNISTNWIRYIMAAYLPLTLFYFIVLFFKVNVASGYLHPVALFGQAISLPPLAQIVLRSALMHPSLLQFTKLFGSFYGIWSLDFFRPFYSDLCLGIGILPTLALDYVIAVYPLLLMIISYLLIVLYDRNYRVVTIMWRPSLFVVAILLGMVPLLFIIVLIFHVVISRWKFFFELIYRIHSRCQRHKALTDSAEIIDSDRVVNPQGYPAIPVRRYNSLVDLVKAD